MGEQKANPAAQALGKLRWKGRSAEERSAHAKMMLDARWHSKQKPDDPSVQDSTKESAK